MSESRKGPREILIIPRNCDDDINENVQTDESSEIRKQPKVADAFVPAVQGDADEIEGETVEEHRTG